MPSLERELVVEFFRLEEERQNLALRLQKLNLYEERRAVLEKQLGSVQEELARFAGMSD